MKRTAILCVCSVLLVAVAAAAQPPGQATAVIEKEVYAALEANPAGTTYVIVMLQPVSTPRAPLPRLREAVAQVEDRVLANLADDEFTLVYRYKTFAALTGHVNAAGLAVLARDPDVVAVGQDGRGEAKLDDSVPFINADDVHALGYTGADITVAVLDTGIDTDHLDLSDDIAGEYHFLDQGADTGPGAEDDNGHGTNVSGIITSAGNVASVGVAPDAQILAIKVLKSDGSGYISDWASGVDYVVDHKHEYMNLGIINMSLGSYDLFGDCPCDNANTWTQLMQTAIQAAKDASIVTFASSGNNGSCTSMTSPACLSSAVAVAAVYDQDLGREPNSGTYQDAYGSSFGDCYDSTTAGDKITCFSNRLDDCNELAAPGRLITAPGMGGGTSTYTGTSQAAPHCSGVAALMWEKCIVAHTCTPTPAYIVKTMKDTGSATDDPCSTTPNPVRVDALAAVNRVCQGYKASKSQQIHNGDINMRTATDLTFSFHVPEYEKDSYYIRCYRVTTTPDVGGVMTVFKHANTYGDIWKIDVKYDEISVPYCTYITINISYVLNSYNSVYIDNVKWSYDTAPGEAQAVPDNGFYYRPAEDVEWLPGGMHNTSYTIENTDPDVYITLSYLQFFLNSVWCEPEDWSCATSGTMIEEVMGPITLGPGDIYDVSLNDIPDSNGYIYAAGEMEYTLPNFNVEVTGWRDGHQERLIGDMNCDGAVNNFDIDAFVLALIGPPPGYVPYYTQYPDCDHMLGDCNGDGNLDNFDIDAFVSVLIR